MKKLFRYTKIKILIFFLIAISMSTVFIKSSIADKCATFDSTTNTLHLPCFNLGSTSFWLDLVLFPSESIVLELKDFGDNGVIGNSPECATFDFSTAVLQIPCFYLEGINYCIDLSLIPADRILLELVGYNFTGVDTVNGPWFGNYSTSLISSAETEFILTQSCTYFTGTYLTVSDSYGGVIEENEGLVYGTINGRVMGNSVIFTLNQDVFECKGTFNGSGTLSSNIIDFIFTGSDCLGFHSDGHGSIQNF